MGSWPRQRASVAEWPLMRRQVEVYGHWPDHPADRAEWTCGSGYLLGGRLVLTAAHVVCPGGQPLTMVQVRDELGLVAARLVWHRGDDEADIAVLEISGSGGVVPVWRDPVRWGEVVTSRTGEACEASGVAS